MKRNLTYPADFEFLNVLEYAALRRMAIEIQFKQNPNSWERIFIDKVKLKDGKAWLTSTAGKIFEESEILAVDTPFSGFDSDEIGCLCE